MTTREEKLRRRALAQAANESRENTQPQFGTQPGVDGWPEVLQEFDEIVIGALQVNAERIRRFKKVYPEANLLLDAGTLCRPAATTSAILDTERRLGFDLPPSYRNFLLASNGLLLPMHGQFCGAETLMLFPDADPDGAAILQDFFGDQPRVSDAEYGAYERLGADCSIRAEYAKSAIMLNGAVLGRQISFKDFGRILLVREVRFESGEYEIWEHGSHHNCRFRSFASYFGHARQEILKSLHWFE